MRKLNAGSMPTWRAATQILAGVATTAALTFGLLTALGAKSVAGTRTALEGAQPYSCGSSCYEKYYQCVISGKSNTYCQQQYSLCLLNCGGNYSPAP
jgi:hypothetical protein